MRKLIMVAIAGFLWKKYQAKRTDNATVPANV